MTLETMFAILLAGLISENYALLHFLGTGAVIENERSTSRSLLLGMGTLVVMVISTLVTWPINHYLLAEVPYLQTLVFVIVVMVVVECIHLFMHLIVHSSLESYCKVDFVKFAINGAILGLCIHNTHLSFAEALLQAEAVGIGFMITIAVFGALHERVDETCVPKPFRGLPISLLVAGMIVLALLALK